MDWVGVLFVVVVVEENLVEVVVCLYGFGLFVGSYYVGWSYLVVVGG